MNNPTRVHPISDPTSSQFEVTRNSPKDDPFSLMQDTMERVEPTDWQDPNNYDVENVTKTLQSMKIYLFTLKILF